VAAALLLALAACGDKTPAPPDPSEQARRSAIQLTDASCVENPESKLITLDTPHGIGVGLPVGDSGDTGIVYLHQSDGGLCQWLPVAMIESQKGYRGISIDNSSSTSPELAAAAVEWLRAKGVKRVFLAGASMGGTHAWQAATLINPPVDGLISLSAPEIYDGINAVEAARTLNIPVFVVAAEFDGNFASAAQTLHDAIPSQHKHLLMVSGSSHGVSMIDNWLQGLIDKFLADPAGYTDPA
jgi:pimeloyl-ACP methyl ester carboxylesterase